MGQYCLVCAAYHGWYKWAAEKWVHPLLRLNSWPVCLTYPLARPNALRIMWCITHHKQPTAAVRYSQFVVRCLPSSSSPPTTTARPLSSHGRRRGGGHALWRLMLLYQLWRERLCELDRRHIPRGVGCTRCAAPCRRRACSRQCALEQRLRFGGDGREDGGRLWPLRRGTQSEVPWLPSRVAPPCRPRGEVRQTQRPKHRHQPVSPRSTHGQ
jgi:hypothetical protein